MDDDYGGMAGFDWKTARFQSAEEVVKRLRLQLQESDREWFGKLEAADAEIDRLRTEVAALRAIESAARNLIAGMGGHHSEIAYQRLVEVLND